MNKIIFFALSLLTIINLNNINGNLEFNGKIYETPDIIITPGLSGYKLKVIIQQDPFALFDSSDKTKPVDEVTLKKAINDAQKTQQKIIITKSYFTRKITGQIDDKELSPDTAELIWNKLTNNEKDMPTLAKWIYWVK